MKKSIFERVLNDVSLDSRIKDGIFCVENETHMDALREYFIKRGIDEDVTIDFCNKILEGKYPERQAYNSKGILVTFPTPEYKQQAIKRGTHFEEDPTHKTANIFSDTPTSSIPDKSKPKPTDTKTSLPLSQTGNSVEQPPIPTTTAPAPIGEPTSSFIEPTELPPPVPKSEAEKESEKKVINMLLKSDDYMLEIKTRNDVLKLIPKLPQRQDSLKSQFKDLVLIAIRMGMFDAADTISKTFLKT
jgi:hypothetical protein